MELEPHILESGYKHLAVSCIIEWNERILLIKRVNNPHKGLYCPVGGKVEQFESPKGAIRREVREETGLMIDTFKMAGIMIETSPTRHNWVSIIYHAALAGEVELQDTEEGILEWVPWAALPEKPLPETDMHIYKCIRVDQQFIFDVHFNQGGRVISIVNELQ